jgi:hypothetical protein
LRLYVVVLVLVVAAVAVSVVIAVIERARFSVACRSLQCTSGFMC